MRYCFALDLKNDSELIATYERYHQEVWPEIIASIKNAGIEQMEIYRIENRLFMMMDTSNHFSFEAKSLADAQNNKVQEWEKLMWQYQQALPLSKPGEKWRLMNKIFDLNAYE